MLGSARARALTIALVALLGACKREEPKPDPNSLAAMEAEWPPHTPSCQAWTPADLHNLAALPEGPHVAAFEQVWRTVAEKHYDPTLACLDWIALRDHYAAKVADAGSDAEAAYAAINELLGLLGQSHLHATAPSGSIVRPRESGPATVPIVVRWLPIEPGSEQRAVVVVDEAVDGHASGLPRGAILTRVGDESVEQLAEQAANSAFDVGRAVGALLSCPEGGSKRRPGQLNSTHALFANSRLLGQARQPQQHRNHDQQHHRADQFHCAMPLMLLHYPCQKRREADRPQ